MAINFTMKHVQIDKNGRYRYRRRVPEILKSVVGKSEFVKVLGISENEALSNYGDVNRHCERLIALAKQGVVDPSPVVQKERLEALLKSWGADPHSSGASDNELTWRDAEADKILAKYEVDQNTGQPIGMSKEDEVIVGALLSGVDQEMPEPTITDAFQSYYKENEHTDPYKRKKQKQRLNRAEKRLLITVKSDKLVSQVTRRDARKLRDTRLETGVSQETVKREFNDIRTVFNFARSELDVTAKNPFMDLKMPKSVVAKQRKIEPLENHVIQCVYEDLKDHKKLLQIWTLLDLTGARLAEIAGLKVNEFVTESNIPHINIKPRDDRSLKNTWSEREIPLIKGALDVARDIVSNGSPDDYAFGKYGPTRAHDNLGAALRKSIRKHTKDRKHVTHSLRHSMKSRLRDAEVYPELARAIQGHAYSLGEDAFYGGEFALDKKLKALLKANP